MSGVTVKFDILCFVEDPSDESAVSEFLRECNRQVREKGHVTVQFADHGSKIKCNTVSGVGLQMLDKIEAMIDELEGEKDKNVEKIRKGHDDEIMGEIEEITSTIHDLERLWNKVQRDFGVAVKIKDDGKDADSSSDSSLSISDESSDDDSSDDDSEDEKRRKRHKSSKKVKFREKGRNKKDRY
jgi:hypothetical protein